MQTKSYSSKMADINGDIVPVTVPVIPAQSDPVFNRFSSLSARARSYKAERELALSEVKALIERDFESAHSSPLSKERCLWKADEFGLTTLKALASTFSENDAPQRLVEFLYSGDPDNFGPFRNSYPFENREITMRELAVFGRQFPSINEKMMFLLLDGLRTSYPMFAREDLTELRREEATAFMAALSFTVAVYEYQSTKGWKIEEAADWDYHWYFEEAQRRCPRFNPEFISLIIQRPDHHEEIMRYLRINRSEMLKIDAEKLSDFLDSPSQAGSNGSRTVMSSLADTRMLLGSVARLGRVVSGLR